MSEMPRSTKKAGGRINAIMTAELALRVKLTAHQTNSTLSDVVNWCLEYGLDRYLRAHKGKIPPRLRPGRKMRLVP